jgi:hypothetical protein
MKVSRKSEEIDLVMDTKDGPSETLADDLIWGIRGIADFLGIKERQAFYMAETRRIPVSQVGSRWVGSRSRLREHFRALLGADRP